MPARTPADAALNHACRQLRRTVMSALFADGALRGLTAAAALWGIGALAARGGIGCVPGWVASLVAGLPLAALACGGVAVLRRLPSARQLRIVMESRNRAGGLIVTADHPGHEAWCDRLGEPPAPAVVRHDRPQLIACLAALLFAAATALVPNRPRPLGGPSALDVRRTLDLLTEQTETLAEEQIIEPEIAQTLERQLEQLWEQASGDDPARTYEALDHLAATLGQEAATAAEEMIGRAEQLATFEALATLLAQMAQNPGHDPEALQQAMQELANALDANPALAELAGTLSKDLAELLKVAALTPSQLAELARLLGQCQNASLQSISKLCDARLLDPDALRKCEAAGTCAGTSEEAKDALLAYLSENPGTEAAALLACLSPGNGGIDRGGGPSAGLTWKQETTSDGAAFEERALPPSPGDLTDAQLVGVSASAPEESPDGTAARPGALAGAAAGTGDAWRRTLLPRHRAPVERYFDRSSP